MEMPVIPVIEVSHLPSSAQFYAAVAQPLGIHFLHHTSVSSLNFGLPASQTLPCEVLFTLCESTSPHKSLLKFCASSQGAVTEFHWRALQATANEIPSTNFLKHDTEESFARITDLDGNVLEARFNRRNSAPINKEARRVLDWQRDVAIQLSDGGSMSSSSGSPRKSPQKVHSSPPREKDAPPSPRLQRRETIATSTPHQTKETHMEVANSILGGISNQALIGTLLGAAAGAAVAYAMVKSEEPKRSDPARPELVSYHSSPPSPISPRVQEVERTIESASTHSESHTEIPANRAEEPRHEAKHGVVNRKESLGDMNEDKSVSPRTRESEPSPVRESERRRGGSEASRSSRHTSKGQRHKEHTPESSSAAENSATGRGDKSDPESHGKSKRKSKTGDQTEAKSQSSHVGAPSEAKSHSHSHRSHASTHSESSTVKPKEKARSRVTTTMTASSKETADIPSHKTSPRPSPRDGGISARDIPLPESTYTVISTRSARHYALPESVVTVAPSDSISSVGMKRERDRRRM